MGTLFLFLATTAILNEGRGC